MDTGLKLYAIKDYHSQGRGAPGYWEIAGLGVGRDEKEALENFEKNTPRSHPPSKIEEVSLSGFKITLTPLEQKVYKI